MTNDDNESNSHFTVKVSLNNYIDGFQLRKAIIPLRFKNVTTSNKTITIAGVDYTLVEGTYNINQIVTDLNTLLAATIYTVEYTNYNRIRIYSTGANFALVPNLMSDLLGFKETSYSGAATYTGEYLPILNKHHKYLTIKSEILTRMSNEYFLDTNNKNSDTLFILPIKEPIFNNLCFEPQQKKMFYVNNKYRPTLIDFSIVDEDDKEFDLSNDSAVIILDLFVKN
ncbi:hypothetical protein KAU11_08460 [Candidatus Babeliales bacterium]|nr:hypothetical protein [Candidatus Babeliales bacterium]